MSTLGKKGKKIVTGQKLITVLSPFFLTARCRCFLLPLRFVRTHSLQAATRLIGDKLCVFFDTMSNMVSVQADLFGKFYIFQYVCYIFFGFFIRFGLAFILFFLVFPSLFRIPYICVYKSNFDDLTFRQRYHRPKKKISAKVYFSYLRDHTLSRRNRCDVVANLLNCINEVGEIKIHPRYCVYYWANALGKVMNSRILFAIG